MDKFQPGDLVETPNGRRFAVIPFAYVMEGDRPRLRSVVGGMVAVAGVIGLTLAR